MSWVEKPISTLHMIRTSDGTGNGSCSCFLTNIDRRFLFVTGQHPYLDICFCKAGYAVRNALHDGRKTKLFNQCATMATATVNYSFLMDLKIKIFICRKLYLKHSLRTALAEIPTVLCSSVTQNSIQTYHREVRLLFLK